MDGDPAAAYRYTEARLDRHRGHHVEDIDKNTRQPAQPTTGCRAVGGRSKVPNPLINGSSGIAVGMATNIRLHNLRPEVAKAAQALIDNPELTIAVLARHTSWAPALHRRLHLRALRASRKPTRRAGPDPDAAGACIEEERSRAAAARS
ncbi:MAG: hypothetical protein IPG75_14685, partial [Gemmatimonadetes bacterium]|nr:hypothetical protein [Gemmatimonadota bacterium]